MPPLRVFGTKKSYQKVFVFSLFICGKYTRKLFFFCLSDVLLFNKKTAIYPVWLIWSKVSQYLLFLFVQILCQLFQILSKLLAALLWAASGRPSMLNTWWRPNGSSSRCFRTPRTNVDFMTEQANINMTLDAQWGIPPLHFLLSLLSLTPLLYFPCSPIAQ